MRFDKLIAYSSVPCISTTFNASALVKLTSEEHVPCTILQLLHMQLNKLIKHIQDMEACRVNPAFEGVPTLRQILSPCMTRRPSSANSHQSHQIFNLSRLVLRGGRHWGWRMRLPSAANARAGAAFSVRLGQRVRGWRGTPAVRHGWLRGLRRYSCPYAT